MTGRFCRGDLVKRHIPSWGDEFELYLVIEATYPHAARYDRWTRFTVIAVGENRAMNPSPVGFELVSRAG